MATSTLPSASVEIYTGPDCSYCLRAKALLGRKAVPYREHDISLPAVRDELLRRLPRARSIPQIFIHGQHVGGCEDLEHLEAEGRLDGMVAGG